MRRLPSALPVAIAAAVAALTAGAAHGEPAATVRLELVDRGDAVEIIARDAQAARLQPAAVRSRLELPLVGAPSASRVAPSDPTVVLIELDGQGAGRVLSIKLGLPRPDVKALATAARAFQVGRDLHVLIPRRVPAAGAAVRLPEPTIAPAPAAAPTIAQAAAPTAAAAPPAAPTAPLAAASSATIASAAPAEVRLGPPPNPNASVEPRGPAAPGPAPAAAPTEITLGPPRPPTPRGPAAGTPAAPGAERAPATPIAAARPEPARPLALAPEPGDGGSLPTLLALGGLASLGAGAWLLRRRRPAAAASSTIEIVAQRSLGGKARVVWLTAGTRELIVSVTGQEVRTLDQWRRSDPGGGAAAGFAAALAGPDLRGEARADPRAEVRSPGGESPLSPAVSGILRLRRTSQFAVAEEVATGDTAADEVWAKEILAATGARR